MMDLRTLDQRIADVAARLESIDRARADERARALEELRIPRDISSNDALDSLASLGSDPLVEALRAWVRRLAVERVTQSDRVRVEREYVATRPSTVVDDVASLRQLCVSATKPSGDGPVRLRAMADHAGAMRSAQHRLAERRREAARRIGVDLEREARSGVEASVVDEALSSWLRRTREPYRELVREGDLATLVERAVACDAGEGWPVHLGTRWMRTQFERTTLVDGLRIPDFAWPEVLGASSFARGLGRFGHAVACADRPRGLPFVLARAPFDALPFRRAALLSGLVLDANYHRRRLGLGRERAREQARRLSLVALAWVRLLAASERAWTLLARADGDVEAARSTEELLEVDVARGLGGILPRARPGALGELVGVALAALDTERLREEFDEDWFDNPRAYERLRHEHHLSAVARPTRANDLQRGFDALGVIVSAALG